MFALFKSRAQIKLNQFTPNTFVSAIAGGADQYIYDIRIESDSDKMAVAMFSFTQPVEKTKNFQIVKTVSI